MRLAHFICADLYGIKQGYNAEIAKKSLSQTGTCGMQKNAISDRAEYEIFF